MQPDQLTDFEKRGNYIDLFFNEDEKSGLSIKKRDFNKWLQDNDKLEWIRDVMPDLNGEPQDDETGTYSIAQYWGEMEWLTIMKDIKSYLHSSKK